MPIIDAIQIEGLSDLRRALRDVDAGLPKAIRLAANTAAEVVVVEAQRDVPVLSGRAKKSIKARSTQTASKITSGGKRAPYMPWLDYGGRVGKNRSINRQWSPDGRYVYPALRNTRREVSAVFLRELRDLATQAGIEFD